MPLTPGTRLGRDVASKVLPQHVSANPETRTRFEREARTISSLAQLQQILGLAETRWGSEP